MGKAKIAIAGNKNQVNEAKAVMTEILAVHHSELTHPGEIHEEVQIPPMYYSYIIGPKGSELKHIQSNFKVRVFIPRGDEEQPVLVVGLANNVERAVKYIEKTCENAANRPTGGRGQDTDGSYMDYDDEGPMEDWMQQYMYKRK